MVPTPTFRPLVSAGGSKLLFKFIVQGSKVSRLCYAVMCLLSMKSTFKITGRVFAHTVTVVRAGVYSKMCNYTFVRRANVLYCVFSVRIKSCSAISYHMHAAVTYFCISFCWKNHTVTRVYHYGQFYTQARVLELYIGTYMYYLWAGPVPLPNCGKIFVGLRETLLSRITYLPGRENKGFRYVVCLDHCLALLWQKVT